MGGNVIPLPGGRRDTSADERDAAQARAFDMSWEFGVVVGPWVIDGNTSREAVQRMIGQ